MPKKKIPIKTRPEAKRAMYQAALKEKMKKWKCFHKDASSRLLCRKFLLHLIKINLIFPLYRERYPNATLNELEILWKDTQTTINSPSRSSSSSSSNSGSPEDLVLRCPRCKSTDVVMEGYGGEMAICRMCAHNWNVGGGHKTTFAKKTGIQMPAVQGYVDSKGREIDPDMPKIFHTRTAKENYLQKSIQELFSILNEYSKQWQVQIWSSFIKHTIFMWVKYLESRPDTRGLPKKNKRTALMAVFAYYGNIMTNRGLSWEKVAQIFNVLPKDMDIMKNNEIQRFWKTPEGAQVSVDLFPLLVIREAPREKEIVEDETLLDKIRSDEPKVTKLGLDAFLAKMEDRVLELPEGVKKAVMNKQLKMVEMWFDDRPSEFKKLF